MTIYLGEVDANLVSNQFQLKPPLGFSAVDSLRLTNYTGDVIVIRNIQGDGQSSEYLMPYMQMVYRTVNTSAIPTFAGFVLGNGVNPNLVLAEWSTEGNQDFIGTYPLAVAVPPIVSGSGSNWTGNTTTVVAAGGVQSVPTDLARLSTTIINNGPAAITVESSLDATFVILLPHASMSYGNGAGALLINNDPTDDAQISWFGETVAM